MHNANSETTSRVDLLLTRLAVSDSCAEITCYRPTYEDSSAGVQVQEESGAARVFHVVKRRLLGSPALA